MNESMIKSIIVLTLVCLISAALLGLVYSWTAEKIAGQVSADEEAKLRQIFPDADNFKCEETSYVAVKNNQEIGYAIITETQGYNSIIKILVGIKEDKIAGIRILSQEETPGLGANAAKPEFYQMFDSLSEADLALKKDGGKIDAITGATITTSAVIAGVKEAFLEIGLEESIEKSAKDSVRKTND